MEPEICEIFSFFKTYLQEDQKLREEIRDVVKNIEQASRDIITILQMIHKNGATEEILSRCKESRVILEKEVKPGYEQLSALFKHEPLSEYYRYHDNWKLTCQKMTFITTLIGYLESGTLMSHEDVAKTLGIKINKEDGFHLDLEDYLMGLLMLPSELARLAVNSVTHGNYKRPLDISQFVAELNAGFRLLNLKNDSLRKRFDGLKYDVKKIEEVVYDLSIRGLIVQDRESQNG